MVLNIAVIIAVCITAGNMDATGSNIPKTNIEGPFSEQEIELAYPILKNYIAKGINEHSDWGFEDGNGTRAKSSRIITRNSILPELTRMAKMLEKNECQSE